MIICDQKPKLLTSVSRLTGAMIVVDQIDTGGAVLTLSNTIVDVDVTVLSHPTLSAFAVVVAHLIGA